MHVWALFEDGHRMQVTSADGKEKAEARAAAIAAIVAADARLPKGHKKPKPGKSFGDLYPEAAAEFHPTKNELTACDYKPGSGVKVWWKCSVCAHEWEASFNNRQKHGCPSCFRVREKQPEKSKSFGDLFPDAAAEFDHSKNELTPFDYDGLEIRVQCLSE